MGSLTPGATYIYERVDNVVYAREAGKTERKPIGWDYQPSNTNQILEEAKMWLDIRRMAETQPALQNALNNAIMIYNIIKESQNEQS